ncbi:hypothetical protein NVP2275O_219 [Vibrio phage 2.275.O._10N.286.54.E11]|nr:hypothetical protein NVP2275O_219 [Vibrio phage 2.275.O._10N.286.54.E11]
MLQNFASNIEKPTSAMRTAYLYALSIGAFDSDKVSYYDFESSSLDDSPSTEIHNSVFEALHVLWKEGFIIIDSEGPFEMVRWNSEDYPIA